MNLDTPNTNERNALSPRWAWGWVALCAAAGVSYYAAGPAVGDAAYTFIGLAVVPLMIFGVVRNRPSNVAPWAFAIACLVIHIVAYVLRDVAGWDWDNPAAPLGGAVPDLVLVAGYLGLIAGMLSFLHTRQSTRDPWVWADGALVTVAAFQIVWVMIVEPTVAADRGVELTQAAVQASHPVLDAILVFLVFRLTFSKTYPVTSFRFFITSVVGFVVADFVLALSMAGHINVSEYAIYGLFIVTYAGIGASALHPSMRLVTQRQPSREAVTGATRLAFVSAALFVPAALFALDSQVAPERRIIMAVSSVLLVGIVVVRVVRAVRDHAASEERLGHQATHDELTGLPNRTLLLEHCTESLARSAAEWDRSTALLFLDLDQFKHVNDTLGHPVGDQMLVAVAQRLDRTVRGGDIVARLGGDEFVICLDGVRGGNGLEEVCERVMALFHSPVALDAGEVFVTPSIGVAISDGSATAESLMRNADIAMYEAKDNGRNGYVFFDEEMREKVKARMDTETKLRHAIDNDELHVAYQPIVALADRSPIGVEALVRWQHPTDGFKSPAEFIPVAEETGLIVRLGEWVLNQSCDALAQWRADHPSIPHLKASVNVSARQLVGAGPCEAVADALARTGLDPNYLWLEVTESLMMGDRATATGMLDDLRAMGVHLAVDDFGTGYSSLTYVRDLPVEIIKIDRSFVSDLDHSDRTKAAEARDMVAAVIAMANALGHQVVAEGIETDAQADLLTQMGCTFGQGYLFSPAVSPDKIDAWLTEHENSNITVNA